MLLENYTGDSKVLKAIAHILNRKAPLPLDGDGNADFGTSGQVLATDGSGSTFWTDGGGSGDVTDVKVNNTSVVDSQGVANITVPTKVSDLTNDSGFITNAVNNLVNYYLKSETYTQAEVDALISAIATVHFEVVQTLPVSDIQTNVIYLVPSSDPGTQNIYDEYINTTGTSAGWELIGSTQVDLSDYVTTQDLNTALADYVTNTALTTILADYVESDDLATVATTGDYDDLTNKPTIPAAQVQSDWNQSDSTAVDYIKNKPSIPTVTKTVFYGTCTGQAANQTKAVVVDSSQGFALTAGIILLVKFDANNTYSATANNPIKLNINSTGAKNIYYGNSNAPTGTNTTAFGRANYVNQYYYDGTNWVWSGSSSDNNTTYTNMSASELATGTATNARTISAKVLTDWLASKLPTVWNRIKTALTARSNLWFADAKISDASADDATKVEVLTELADETAFDNLPTDGTADGMYAFPDSGAEYLDASMVGYGSGTVADALTWHEAASYIDAFANAVSEIALVGYADIHAPNKIGLVLIVPKILITDTYRFFQVGDRYNTSNQWHLQARMSIYGADAVGFYKDASEDSTATYKWLYK